MTLLLEFFYECTIRVTVLLEYLDRLFSICSCHLFYNSLVFNCFVLSFGRGSLPCIVHLHSNFQLIPLCILYDTGGNYIDFKIDRAIFTKVGLSFISLLSLTQLILAT